MGAAIMTEFYIVIIIIIMIHSTVHLSFDARIDLYTFKRQQELSVIALNANPPISFVFPSGVYCFVTIH